MITQEILKELLDYNSKTGKFTWLVSRRGKIKAGQQAGTINSEGYINMTVDGQYCKAHRLAWLYIYGNMPPYQIDHINGNPSDNRICNLREATQSQNQFNKKIGKNNSSGYKGVSWHKATQKWRVRINVDEEQLTIGYFDDAELAGLIAEEVRNKYHGKYARHK